ncbi:MAG TPA: helix-turn-helix domain-containing protein [Methylomirabilota bacterium]|nr:helix-turn-helix domain-containing protein [Methylomirabilota bacterium]
MKRTAHNKYNVTLTNKDHQQIEKVIRRGVSNARVNTRARVLLAANEGKQDREICEMFHVHRSTVHDIRQHYCEEGLNRALYDLPRSGQPRKLTGVQEAHVIAIACTKAPEGYAHWTMDLITEEIQDKLTVSISRSAVYNVLLRNDTKPWLKKNVGDFRDYA